MITTDRIHLRRFKDSDLASLTEMLMDQEVMKYTGFKTAQSAARARELLNKWMSDQEVWAAVKREGDEFIGWIMLKKTISADPEIGFMLPRSHWHKGYATEMAKALLKYAEECLGVTRVIASVRRDHADSIHVLRKIGMSESLNLPPKAELIYFEVEWRVF